MAERPRKIRRLEKRERPKQLTNEQIILREEQWKSRKIHVVEDKEDIEPLENSRLQLLNDDCLCSIFDRLSIVDLSRISQLDQHFHVLIKERVIHKKLIDINYLLNLPEWFTNRILKQFSQRFRRIRCQEEQRTYDDDTFERFVELITKHCSPNTFTEVEMKFRDVYFKNPDVERLSIPYFSKVEKLTLRGFGIEENNVEFFKALANNVTDLKVLTMHDVCVSSRMQFNFDLSAFLKSKPKLRTFSYRGNDDIPPLVVDSLKRDCTDLKTYNHIHLSNPYSRFNTIPDEMKDSYNYLCDIVNLKNVTLTSYTHCASDIYYPLQKLAAKNQLESLKVYVDIDNGISLLENERFLNTRQSFGHFTSLRNIDIKIVSRPMDRHDLKTNFLLYFMSTCRFLNRVRIIGDRIDNVSQILEIVPNIRVLCLGEVRMNHLPVQMRKIVQSAKKIRKRQMELGEDKPLIHLNLNIWQWREVQACKNIDDILTSSIDGTINLRKT